MGYTVYYGLMTGQGKIEVRSGLIRYLYFHNIYVTTILIIINELNLLINLLLIILFNTSIVARQVLYREHILFP